MRNLTWLMLLLIFILVNQLPSLTMAPYIATIQHRHAAYIKDPDPRDSLISYDLGKLIWQMSAAFASVNVPKIYAFLFYLAAFLTSLMFLCVGVLTIVDTIMDTLLEWIEKHTCSRIYIHLLLTFCITIISKGMGIIQTTKAGHYYFLLIVQSMDKLRAVLILLIALGLLIVYVRQNFGLIERILISFWFVVSFLISASLWGYNLYLHILNDHGRLIYDSLSEMPFTYFPDEWKWGTWSYAAFPMLGIITGIINICFSCCSRNPDTCGYLFCGETERVREQDGEDYSPPPLLPPEPSAPPYMYSYMESHNGGASGGGYHNLDHYKLDYDPPETEPLTRGDRSTRI